MKLVERRAGAPRNKDGVEMTPVEFEFRR